ncbi:hypothetical protein baBA2_000226 [Borrelia anserina]|uniref:Membrane associated protein n=2 Tax=Borrelia anserina TaxID=143 RepID=A0ABM6FTU5_BORAN|nr:hypothetical protein [Borrelia anserina]AHH08197.1 Putative membrane associated protein [Borrelia anserina BA2]APR64724.1 hypothetical protein N187_01125 [Borrelia anserina Es]UPA06640.1 hypothetical protein baBA2_000226 [Borrelia anserina]
MNKLFFDKIRLIFIFLLNASLSVFYMLLYSNIFGTFILVLILISFFVIISCLRYFYKIDYKGNKIFYKKFYFRINFDFNDIVWIEKRLLDNTLVLGLNNGLKIKVSFLRKEYLSKLLRELRNIKSDLFIAKAQEFPMRYYISGIYLLVFLFQLLTSILVYYIAFSSIIIFFLILLIGIKVLIDDILVIKDLVIFYEFRQNSVYERKIFSGKEYFYKFFDNVSIHGYGLCKNSYLSFIYNHKGAFQKLYIRNERMSYSIHKVFAYIEKYCNGCA